MSYLSENNIEDMLASLNAPDSFPGREAMWSRIKAGARVKAPVPGRRIFRAGIIAAALVMITFVTAFADEIAEIINSIVNGNISATAYTALQDQNSGREIGGRVIISADGEWTPAAGSEYAELGTLEDAINATPFPLKAPACLPEGYSLCSVKVVRAPDGAYGKDAMLEYRVSAAEPYLGQIMINQYWAGGDASVSIDVVDGQGTLEAVTVNGCEGIYTPVMGLHWIQDGVYCRISSGFLTLDELLLVAESME
ncbi:MAG: DUF4367 domain-containing protein [Clostridiales bacterium]|jgi:hypothetical protein|nr:DUF4367 domain-containing protein [Clostridiales bacterium]